MSTLGHQSQLNRKVLVVQRGARHRYAIPRLLEEAGMLAALYTDSNIHSTMGRIAAGLGSLGVRTHSLRALASRVPEGIPSNKIFSSDRALHLFSAKNRDGANLGKDYTKWGLQGADVVYSMYGENLDFLRWAKVQAAKIVVDVFVHPETNRIVTAEEVRVSGRACADFIRGEDKHSKRVFELADLLLCPSEWVADGIRAFSPEHTDKIRVLPYGSSVDVAKTINSSESGRVLFAGREPLRKGLHYLAKAAFLLRKEGLELDVRVAGVSEAEIAWMEHCEELNCLGTVPMEQMKQEYVRASAFVLPSLSEGQAGVLLEAMACGCPVIATKESGVDFDSGCGVTVPAGDAACLAEELRKVLTDESYRTQLAKGALEQAQGFSMDAWKRRLVDCMQEFNGGPSVNQGE